MNWQETYAIQPLRFLNGTKPIPFRENMDLCINSYASYSIQEDPTAINYHWYTTGGSPIIDTITYDPTIDIYFDAEGTRKLFVEIVNDCGTGLAEDITIQIKKAAQSTIKRIDKPLLQRDRLVRIRS